MKTFLTVIVIAALAGGAWWFFMQNQTVAPLDGANATTTPSQTDSAPTTDTGTGAAVDVGVGVDTSTPGAAAVTYTSSGFAPTTVTIKKGGTVTWSNTGGTSMWVASAQHPTHTTYAGTSLQEHCDDATDISFDQCKNGSSYSFTFSKVGTWNYHNHSNSSQFGKVIVVE